MIVINIIHYLLLLLVIFLLAKSGYILSVLIFKTKNKIFHLGSGIILGFCGYLILLSFSSYVYKGPISIFLYFILFNFLCLIVIPKRYNKKLDLSFPIKKLFHKNPLTFSILIIYSIVFFVYADFAVTGGDVITHWSISASFANGNYPTHSPWQPQYLTAYHHGTFMILGALSVLSELRVGIVHFFFAATMVIAIFVLITGIAQGIKKTKASLIPAILGVVVFSGPYLLVSGYNNFFNLFLNASPTEIIKLIGNQPLFVNSLDIAANAW